MTREEFKDLAARIQNGQASQEELRLYNTWFNSFQHGAISEESLAQQKSDILLRSINREIGMSGYSGRVARRWLIAASVLLMSAAGTYFYSRYRESASVRFADDVPAAKNSATLLLAGGQKLNLSDIPEGDAYNADGMKISKTARGELRYEVSGDRAEAPSGMHILKTAKGESFRIVLADGTSVLLNAGSALKFPVSFKEKANRKVELSGEAYFEVAKDREHPFVVSTPAQNVTVLGTQFNVCCYPGEREKTTLIEGSVAVSLGDARQILRPGQEAVLAREGLKVQKADTVIAVAWKNSMIMFEREPIKNIMNILGRWYNVDIEYRDGPVTETYTGSVPSSQNLSEVLKMLEKSGGVRFEIKDKTIIVKRADSFF